MKVTVFCCDPDAPLQVPLQQYERHDSYEMESTYEEVNLLLENLSAYGNHLNLISQHLALDFGLCSEGKLQIEVFDARDGFTALAADQDLAVGRKVIEMAFHEERFTDLIPTTDQPWWAIAYV